MAMLMVYSKISLILLFGLSLILIGITLYRVVGVIDRHSDQQFRSLLASLEILAAAAVSNALVLGSFIRDRGAKKQRFKFGSVGGSSSLDRAACTRRGTTLTARNWGSDADLVGDLGMRLEPELSAGESQVPRPAPVALPHSSQAKNLTPNVHGWTRTSEESDETDMKSIREGPVTTPITTPRQMSFFDVGGLLDDDGAALPHYPAPMSHSRSLQSSSSPRLASHTEIEEFTVHHSKQGGTNASFQDLGGLLSSPSKNFSRPSVSHSPKPEVRRSPGTKQRQAHSNPLRDVGGLLT